MVLLNSKVYSPSAYVGSPCFTRMEKTICTKLATGEDYPTMSEVGVVPLSSFGMKTELSLFSWWSQLRRRIVLILRTTSRTTTTPIF